MRDVPIPSGVMWTERQLHMATMWLWSPKGSITRVQNRENSISRIGQQALTEKDSNNILIVRLPRSINVTFVSQKHTSSFFLHSIAVHIIISKNSKMYKFKTHSWVKNRAKTSLAYISWNGKTCAFSETNGTENLSSRRYYEVLLVLGKMCFMLWKEKKQFVTVCDNTFQTEPTQASCLLFHSTNEFINKR